MIHPQGGNIDIQARHPIATAVQGHFVLRIFHIFAPSFPSFLAFCIGVWLKRELLSYQTSRSEQNGAERVGRERKNMKKRCNHQALQCLQYTNCMTQTLWISMNQYAASRFITEHLLPNLFDQATLNGPAPRGHSYQHQRPSPAPVSGWKMMVLRYHGFNTSTLRQHVTCRYVPGTSFLKPCSQRNTLLAHIFWVLEQIGQMFLVVFHFAFSVFVLCCDDVCQW